MRGRPRHHRRDRAPPRVARPRARGASRDFAEVQLVCPLDVARERERTRPPGHHPRGIYARAGRPGATVPGRRRGRTRRRSRPSCTIDTTPGDRGECRRTGGGARADVHARVRRRAAPSRRVGDLGQRAAGSGKTTVVSRRVRTAQRTRRDGSRCSSRASSPPLIAPRRVHPSHMERHMVTRAIVLAARLLIDAGPGRHRRRRRAGARGRSSSRASSSTSFAQVELVCPPEVCRTRERAVRWNLVPCPVAVAARDVARPRSRLRPAPRSGSRSSTPTSSTHRTAAERGAAPRGSPRTGGEEKETVMRVRDLMTPIRSPSRRAPPSWTLGMMHGRTADPPPARARRTTASLGIVTDRDIRLNLPSPATTLSIWELELPLEQAHRGPGDDSGA